MPTAELITAIALLCHLRVPAATGVSYPESLLKSVSQAQAVCQRELAACTQKQVEIGKPHIKYADALFICLSFRGKP